MDQKTQLIADYLKQRFSIAERCNICGSKTRTTAQATPPITDVLRQNVAYLADCSSPLDRNKDWAKVGKPPTAHAANADDLRVWTDGGR
jgi:hypothetical protein